MLERVNGIAVAAGGAPGFAWAQVSETLSVGFTEGPGVLRAGVLACGAGRLVYIGDPAGALQDPEGPAIETVQGVLTWLRQGFVRFAAIWVSETELKLITDHAAMVPLFYRSQATAISIATSARLLAAADGEPLHLRDYAGRRPLPLRGDSNFEGVCAIPPGCIQDFGRSGSSWKRQALHEYASLPQEPDVYGLEAAVQLTADAISLSVLESLRGVRSAALTLSGGVDSAAVAYFARQAVEELDSFTVGTPYGDEFAQAREVAEAIGTRHHEVQMTQADAEALLPQLIAAFETWDPLTLQIAMPVSHLYQTLARRYPLFLTGYGSDLIHAGVVDVCARSDAVERSILEGVALTVPTNELSHQFAAEHGVVVRYPYWSYRSQVAALRVGGALKISQGIVKHAFRSSMAGFLPPSIAWRRKLAIHEGMSMKSIFDRIFHTCDPRDHLSKLHDMARATLHPQVTGEF